MSHTVAYWDHPDQVVWVDLPHRRLQGFDNYWVAWPRYGMWQDPENIGTVYTDSVDARHVVAFEDRGDHEVELPPGEPVPAGAVILRGFMLTDEQARLVGLI